MKRKMKDQKRYYPNKLFNCKIVFYPNGRKQCNESMGSRISSNLEFITLKMVTLNKLEIALFGATEKDSDETNVTSN